jgi:hypothetical protein
MICQRIGSGNAAQVGIPRQVSALVRTPPKIAEDLFDFVKNPESPEKPDASSLQAKTGLEADGKTLWHVGLNNRPQIV